ncbi:MAG: PKD domain-containing protein [Bacteroidota bacterium]|nr:PKD domain-containing protein [Bacteroidota bacterium]
MFKNITFILLLLSLSVDGLAQNIIHLCVGTTDNNFSVPYTLGSTYQWSIQGNPNIATITSGNGTEHIKIDLNNTGVFKLVVDEVDINGCLGSDSIFIEIHILPIPYITALGPISFCQGDGVFLQVDSTYTSIVWNNNVNTILNYIDTSGDYFVDVIDGNGCTNTSNIITVDVHPRPIVNFSIEGICLDEVTVFTDSSSIISDNIIDHIWNFGDGLSGTGPIVSHTYNTVGNYYSSLLVISDYGCMDSLTKLLTIYPNPNADFTFSPVSASILDPIISFNNISVNTSSYIWNFDDSLFSFIENPVHEFENPGVYDVMLTVGDINQCIDSISYQIIIYYDFVLHIPNSFTPNEDGKNDIFIPSGIRMDKYKSYQFSIFNRWGGRIYSTNEVTKGWDGSDAVTGIYTWSIIIEDELGNIHKRSGEVRLIK